MTEHVEELLFQQTLGNFRQLPINMYSLLSCSSTSSSQWTLVHGPSSPLGYQCILLFGSPDPSMICQLDHTIDSQAHIPCYNMEQFWSKEDIDLIQSQLHLNTPFALGVPKTNDTKQLGINLWRCRQFITN